ncbi:MAG: hypothetical protein IJA26_07760 [Clostridia bacterium]|nr:hypothetical protein [Clostridia bacterium]
MKKLVWGIIASVLGTIAVFALLIAWLFHVPELPFAETPEDFGGDICFIVRDHSSEENEIEYYTLDMRRHKVAQIPPFENEAEIYLSHYDNFSCSVEDGKVVNRLVDTKLTDLDGNPVEDIENREIIDRIFEKAAEIDHDIFRMVIIELDGEYFAQVNLNVNWVCPCDVYYYDSVDDSFREIYSFEHRDIIGAKMIDAAAFK